MSLARLVPVLGTIVLLGAIVHVVLGFQVAADVQGLREIHMGIGILGLVLVVGLAVLAFRARAGIVHSKVTMTILTIIVLVQVVLGFQLLQGADALLVSHEAGAFLIMFLALVTGGITFWNGTRKIQART
jgi:heme A synthase